MTVDKQTSSARGPNASPTTGKTKLTSMQKKVLLGSSAGQFIEFYDFSLYGLSAVILSTHFFPTDGGFIGLLIIFATYGVTFLMRPLGGLFFGSLGDKIGRRRTLAITLFLVGGCTTLIGVLPTYAQIGWFAPVLLVLIRLLQGVSAGGESAGGPSFAYEHAPEHSRATWVNITIAATSMSTVFASVLIFGIDSATSAESYESWGWRLPFLFALPLTLVGLWIRSKTEESQMFLDSQAEKGEDFSPVKGSFRQNGKQMFQVVVVVGVVALAIYFVTGYFATYIEIVGELTRGQALLTTAITLGTFAVLLPLFGKIGDRVGRRPMIYTGLVLIGIISIPAFALVSSGDLGLAILGGLLFVAAVLVYGGGCYVFFLEVFPTKTRFTSAAFSYNIAYGVFGGTAPLIGTALVEWTGSSASPGYYMAALAAVAIVLALVSRVPETKGLNR